MINSFRCLIFALLLFNPSVNSAQSDCDSLQLLKALDQSDDLLNQGQVDMALEGVQLLLNRLEECTLPDGTFRVQSLERIGDIYRDAAAELLYRGLINSSIDITERRIALYRNIVADHADDLANAYLDLSRALGVNGDRGLAIEVAINGLKIRQANNPQSTKIAFHYDRIVDNFLALSDPDGALPYLNAWENFQRNNNNASLSARVSLANNWAMYFYNKGAIKRAIQVLEDTLAIYGEPLQAKGSMAGAMVSIAEFNLCEYYAILGNYERSLFYAEKNVALFEKKLQAQQGKLFGQSHYTWCLAQSAKAAWGLYQQTNDSSWYHFAEHRSQQAEDLIFTMRDRAPNNGFMDWMGDDIDIVANIAEVRQGLFAKTGDKQHVERAFEAVEASKTFAMQQFLHETYALRWSNLPDSLYQQETSYRQEINDLEANFFMLRKLPDAEHLNAQNDQKLFALRDAYKLFLDDLEKNYPTYFRLKYRHPAVDINQIQQHSLQPGQCMLDLYIRNDLVFALLIRPDTIIWCATPYDSLAHEAISILENDSRNFATIQNLPENEYLKQLQAYADAAYKAYQVLIEPVRAMLSEEVLLIPRNELSVFPFGALLTQEETNMSRAFQWHYLENELVISQAFSAGLFQFVQKRPMSKKPPGTVLAFAPFFESKPIEEIKIPVGDLATLTRGEIFKQLPYSGAEANAIAQRSHGEALVGAKATKAAFLEKSPDFKVLHLATHSAANDVLGEYSFVALQAENKPGQIEMLYARDIYGLPLNSDLVVLSACETALGQYRDGEGVIGLTRAFTCAGARNVVASLWAVNDASTKDLMLDFYAEIGKGASYNIALTKAKRQFIQKHREYGHPYYWAGFVLHGR